MKETAEKLAQIVDQVALALNPAPVGPYPLLVLDAAVDGCRFKIKFMAHPDFAHHRAKRLRKTRIAGTDGFRECARASRWKPSRSRPRKPNEAVVRRFLNDGEVENAQAYRDVFND